MSLYSHFAHYAGIGVAVIVFTAIALIVAYFLLAGPLEYVGIYDPPRTTRYGNLSPQEYTVMASYVIWIIALVLGSLYAIGRVVAFL